MSLTALRAGMLSPAMGLPAREPRTLRVAASVCSNRVEALRLMALLSCHPRLQAHQLALLTPADATPQRFSACRQRWDRLRPEHEANDEQDTPVPLALAGAALGALVGLVLGALSGVPLDEAIALMLLCALSGMVIATLAKLSAGATQRRFDRLLQRSLSQGRHAVVVMGVRDEDTSAHLLQAIRQGGVSWCAEAPRRRG